MATLLLIANRSLAYKILTADGKLRVDRQGYYLALMLGWLSTGLTAAIYILFTYKYVNGPYDLAALATFSCLNGTLEQGMFIFWFIVGAYSGVVLIPNRPKLFFGLGFFSYVVYSGLIHPLFWFSVLPAHEPFLPMVAILPLMSLSWMWLLWRYQAIAAIVAMHIGIDFLTVGHLHFSWFESLQWHATHSLQF